MMSLLESECLECGNVIELPEDVHEGDLVTCEECGMELEVSAINDDHVIFDLAPEEEEDDDLDDEEI